MSRSTLETGKFGELWVFAKLLDLGVNVYTPLVDEEGIDAIVCSKSRKLVPIQIKSTRASDQAGYFNAYVAAQPDLHLVCVDLSPLDTKPPGAPETWVFPRKVFTDHAAKQTSGEYRLALAAVSRKDGKPRKEVLKSYREAWDHLTS